MTFQRISECLIEVFCQLHFLSLSQFLLQGVLISAVAVTGGSLRLYVGNVGAGLASPLMFFDTTPVGRILNHFSVQHLSHVMRNPAFAICEQQRRRSACTSVQSDQHLCCSLPGRTTEILKSKSVCLTDDVIDVIRTCVQQSQIVKKINDSSFSSQKCIRN